jgi:hypothetical protein
MSIKGSGGEIVGDIVGDIDGAGPASTMALEATGTISDALFSSPGVCVQSGVW